MSERDAIVLPVIDQRRLPLWVIYDHPADFPDHFVARMHYCLPWPEPTGVAMTSPNIEALRLYFAACSYSQLPRDDNDDPVIVESWLS